MTTLADCDDILRACDTRLRRADGVPVQGEACRMKLMGMFGSVHGTIQEALDDAFAKAGPDHQVLTRVVATTTDETFVPGFYWKVCTRVTATAVRSLSTKKTSAAPRNSPPLGAAPTASAVPAAVVATVVRPP